MAVSILQNPEKVGPRSCAGWSAGMPVEAHKRTLQVSMQCVERD